MQLFDVHIRIFIATLAAEKSINKVNNKSLGIKENA